VDAKFHSDWRRGASTIVLKKTLWKRLHSRGKQIMDDLRNTPWIRLAKDLAEKTRSGLISLMNR
jgi:hypothetical protein